MTRTYSRDEWLRAQAEWSAFGSGWTEIRRLASEWSIYPPSGSRWDQWDGPEPTQAAIVARCMDANLPELYRILGRVRSWSKVVASIIQLEARLDEEADQRERDIAREKAGLPDHVGAAMSLKAILNRIGDS